MSLLAETGHFTSWKTFIKVLKQVIGEIDSGETVRLRIGNLCQIGSVNKYSMKFQTDMGQLKWNEKVQKDKFFEGLHPKSETDLLG